MASNNVTISKEECYQTFKLLRKDSNDVNKIFANVETVESILSHHGITLQSEPTSKVILESFTFFPYNCLKSMFFIKIAKSGYLSLFPKPVYITCDWVAAHTWKKYNEN